MAPDFDLHTRPQHQSLPVHDVAVTLTIAVVDVQLLHRSWFVVAFSRLLRNIFDNVPIRDKLRYCYIRINCWSGTCGLFRMSLNRYQGQGEFERGRN